MIEKMKVTDLVWDTTLYPRQDVSDVQIARMVDALRCGEKFPPIIVDTKSQRIIDGTHRWKATIKFMGEEALIECDLRDFENDAAMFLAAVHSNTGHGLGLNSFERTKCLLRMKELGIERDVALTALRMTADRGERMEQTRTAYRVVAGKKEPIAIKGAMHDFKGQEFTKKQEQVNRYSGGMRPGYYIQQIIGLVESGLIIKADDKTIELLATLRDLLVKKLPHKNKKAS